MTATMTPAETRRRLSESAAVLIDVREPDEHAAERIDGARLIPLGTIDRVPLPAAEGRAVIVHCKSGRRSQEAVSRLAARGVSAVSLEGGIEAWKAQGLPVVAPATKMPIPIMRQVQITVGVLSLAGSALAWWVSPLFIAVPAFLGAGLLFAGVTGTCGLAMLLSAMPWNAPLRAIGAGGVKACAVKV